MNDSHTVLSVASVLETVSQRCHLCPPDCVEEMVTASLEIDKAVSTMSGTEHVTAPSGEGGAPAARFYLVQSVDKLRGLNVSTLGQDSSKLLRGVLRAATEMAAVLSL